LIKIYVSYKQTGVNDNVLKKELKLIKKNLNFLGIDNFIWYLDENRQKYSTKQVLEITKINIIESNAILCFINHGWISEWMFYELWVADYLQKDIIVFINEKLKDKFWSIYWLTEDIIFFHDLVDFEKKFINFFGIQYPRKFIDQIDIQIIDLIKKKIWLYSNYLKS